MSSGLSVAVSYRSKKIKTPLENLNSLLENRRPTKGLIWTFLCIICCLVEATKLKKSDDKSITLFMIKQSASLTYHASRPNPLGIVQ